MKRNKKSVYLISIFVFFVLLYLLFAVKFPKKSLVLEPEWTIDLEKDKVLQSFGTVYPFHLGSSVGYFTSDGAISSLAHLDERCAISESYIAFYGNSANQIPFFGPSLTQRGVIDGAGFPFFDEDRIFLIHTSGNSFSSHYTDGSQNWSYGDYAPITCFDSVASKVAAGFANGTIIVFNNNGIIQHEIAPGGSTHEIIFGLSLADSGRYVACVSGVERQRLVVSDISESTNKIIFHQYVKKELLEQSYVAFSKNEKYVFFNEKDSLVVANIEEKTSKTIPLTGKIVSITEADDGKFYFVLSKTETTSEITIFNEYIHKVGSFSFDENNAFVSCDNGFLYVGSGTTISKIAIR